MTTNPSAEQNALAAVMDGDPEAAKGILEDFFPSELAGLAEHLAALTDLIAAVRRGKSAR